jgi:hypothetical protein
VSLTLEELRSRVVAIPGDLLLCPGCREPLLLFTTSTFRDAEVQPGARKKPGTRTERFTLHCGLCGAGAIKRAAGGDGTIETSVAPRALVRSGSWVGWRALGGE